jgi:hypothetical protein
MAGRETSYEDIFGVPVLNPYLTKHLPPAEETREIERMSPKNRIIAIRGRIEGITTRNEVPPKHLVRLAKKYKVHYYGDTDLQCTIVVK